MDILQAIILGIVQGIGEFLPISSTAHLVLVPYFLGWDDPGLAFDVALHAGTLVAVMIYFWNDWIEIIRSAFGFKKINFSSEKYNKKLLKLLVIATIPGALAGYFLESYAENIFRNPLIIAFTLSFVGIVLYIADKFLKHKKNINDLTVKNAFLIGIAQAIAIVPGVSRSGATMIAGLGMGLSREGAARFSFLMSMPIILGATLANFPDFFSGTFQTWPLIFGVTSSAISGYWAISFLLKFLQKASFVVFVWYRIILAAIIATVYFVF